MERAHSVIDQLTLKEGDLHKLAKDTEDAEAAGLRRIFDDVVQIENRYHRVRSRRLVAQSLCVTN